MPKLKYILYSIGALSLVLAIVLSLWVFQLSQEVQTRLQTKKFLPPTEYYSRGFLLIPGSGITQPQLLSEFSARQYRMRDKEQKLFPGDYLDMKTIEECRSWVSDDLPSGATSCTAFAIKATDDPEQKEAGLKMLIWDANQILVETREGNPLKKTPKVELEPELIAQYIGGDPVLQKPMALGEMPTLCLNAVLAIEDARFLEHFGVSLTGIARAALKNAFGHGVKQGGSTITQQLVKNYFLSSERTVKRKITEILMSLVLENYASKDEILETYLNIIYLGQKGPFQIRGFGAAADYYFQKPIANLETNECALLAAIVNSPGLFDPFKNQANALKRRKMVLDRMQELHFISDAEAQAAQKSPLPVSHNPVIYETAPYYLDAVNKQMKSAGVTLRDAKIYTGLLSSAQQSAQDAVRKNLAQLEIENKTVKEMKEKGHVLEGVLLSVENSTGLISAVVGERSFKLTQFNRAIDGHRQVGSVMKPFVYLTALIAGEIDRQPFDPLTTLHDENFVYKFEGQTWSPENFGKKYFGDVPAYFALKSSLNAATASLGLAVGLNKIIPVARAMGIKSDLRESPSLTLGSFELYPLEVAEAYTTMARLGSRTDLSFVKSVVDDKGKILYKFEPKVDKAAIDPVAMAGLVGMMKQTIISGTARSAFAKGFTQPAAGKTGTSSNSRDAWFAGFTPSMTTITWVGYDDNTTAALTGASGPLPIWTDYMKSASVYFPKNDFPWPEGTEIVKLEEDGQPVELIFQKGRARSH